MFAVQSAHPTVRHALSMVLENVMKADVSLVSIMSKIVGAATLKTSVWQVQVIFNDYNGFERELN